MKTIITAAVLGMAALSFGQGAGKVSYRDFGFIAKSNAVLEIQMANGTRHSGGVNVCMGDGSVRFLSQSVDAWPAGQTIRLRIASTNNQGRSASGNNLKQILLASHNIAEVRLFMVEPKDGKLVASMEHTFKGVKVGSARAGGKGREIEILSWSFGASNPSTATVGVLDPASGQWRLKNSNSG